MRGPTVVLDMDEVLVEINPVILGQVAEATGEEYFYRNLYRYAYEEVLSPRAARVARAVIARDDLYDGLGPVPGALDAVEALRSIARVVVASVPHPGHAGSKLNWLLRHGFKLQDVVLTGDKTVLDADVLVDDAPHHVQAWTRNPDRYAVIYDRPWNEALGRFYPGTTRVRSWVEIPDAVRLLLERTGWGSR